MSKRFLTAKSICMGHPDKLYDLIADSILDACLRTNRLPCEDVNMYSKIQKAVNEYAN